VTGKVQGREDGQGAILREAQDESAASGAAKASVRMKTRSFAQGHTLTISPAANTPPFRLSAVSGEKLKQFADLENRKSPIANSPDDQMAR
jgi:hypothetical protein